MKHLETPIFDFSFGKKFASVLHKLVEIALLKLWCNIYVYMWLTCKKAIDFYIWESNSYHVLKDKVQDVIFSNNFLELHYIWILHFPEWLPRRQERQYFVSCSLIEGWTSQQVSKLRHLYFSQIYTFFPWIIFLFHFFYCNLQTQIISLKWQIQMGKTFPAQYFYLQGQEKIQ